MFKSSKKIIILTLILILAGTVTIKAENQLADAAQYGYIRKLKDLIEAGEDIHERSGYYNATPLMLAARSGNVEAVKILLEAGAEVNATAKDNWTALMFAAVTGHARCVEILLEAGADVNTVFDGEKYKNSLFLAVSDMKMTESSPRVVEILVNTGADLDILNDDGNTVLMYNLTENKDKEKRNEIAKILIEAGADLTITNDNNDSALTFAAANDSLQVVKKLIDKEADVNIQNYNGRTPLMNAAWKGNREIVKLLIDSGADLNKTCDAPGNHHGKTALHFALISSTNDYADKYGKKYELFFKHSYAADIFIDAGADINIQDAKGKTPLHYAVQRRYPGIAKKLIKSGAELDVQDEYKKTPLHYALFKTTQMESFVREKYSEMANMLIEAGADPDIRNEQGQSALLAAVDIGELKIANKLIEKGANLDIQDEDGETALIHLADIRDYDDFEDHYKFMETAEKLVEAGANLDLKDKHGNTALYYSILNGNIGLAKKIVDNGARLNLQYRGKKTLLDYDGRTVLMCTAAKSSKSEKDYLGLMEKIIKADADLDIQDDDKKTALMYALDAENTQAAIKLIQAGAAVNIKDEGGETALLYTAENYWDKREDYNRLIQTLLKNGAEVNISNSYGETPLMLAAGRGNLEIVKLMVTKGAHINACNKNGETPLIYAAGSNNLELVKYLLNRGANINAEMKGSNEGWTVLDYIIKYCKNKEIVEYIKAVENGQVQLSDVKKEENRNNKKDRPKVEKNIIDDNSETKSHDINKNSAKNWEVNLEKADFGESIKLNYNFYNDSEETEKYIVKPVLITPDGSQKDDLNSRLIELKAQKNKTLSWEVRPAQMGNWDLNFLIWDYEVLKKIVWELYKEDTDWKKIGSRFLLGSYLQREGPFKDAFLVTNENASIFREKLERSRVHIFTALEIPEKKNWAGELIDKYSGVEAAYRRALNIHMQAQSNWKKAESYLQQNNLEAANKFLNLALTDNCLAHSILTDSEEIFIEVAKKGEKATYVLMRGCQESAKFISLLSFGPQGYKIASKVVTTQNYINTGFTEDWSEASKELSAQIVTNILVDKSGILETLNAQEAISEKEIYERLKHTLSRSDFVEQLLWEYTANGLVSEIANSGSQQLLDNILNETQNRLTVKIKKLENEQ